MDTERLKKQIQEAFDKERAEQERLIIKHMSEGHATEDEKNEIL